MYEYIILDDTTFRTLSLKNDEYEVKCDRVSFYDIAKYCIDSLVLPTAANCLSENVIRAHQ